MGLNIKAFRYIQMLVHDTDREFASSRICLLGNLYFARGTNCIQKKYGTKIVHEYFEQGDADVVSIDINGKDGALPLDLEKPLPKSVGTFDIIINGGTTEHIKKQYECFQNIHNLCKMDGLMFHMIPLKGHWLRHAQYSYAESFFKDLANRSHYDIVDMRVDSYVSEQMKGKFNVIFVCLKKKHDVSFGGLSTEYIQENKRWRRGS